ncbi:DMT family transporter [Vallicoccus soli]|uniref:EamA family transporter n=1 Tax=Vallicoccus soli TaxID=2339232 RepID=A0A3A3ZIZ9_9ACTN|nr:EamA family transporter [Vallicoccus soli]
MEGTWRWSAVAAVAPVTWGATYYVTGQALPTGSPLWGAVLRAVPAGLVLLALRRRLPAGSWWWRSAVLGTLNTGAFFALVYVAAQLLPTSVAATVMATSPLLLLLLAWPLLGRRPAALPLAGAGLGLAGVALLVGAGTAAPDPRGVLASVTALLMASLGYVLAARWGRDPALVAPDVLSGTAWQLLAGGLALVPAAAVVEGAPPALDAPAVAGFAFVSLVATALAFSCWFAGLARLDPGTVGLLGLLNPLTGVALGTALAGERLGPAQGVGVLLVLAGVLAGQPAAARYARRRPSRSSRTATGSPPNRRPSTSSAPTGDGASGSTPSVPAGASGRSPSTAPRTATPAAADHACGRQAAG